MLVLKTLFKIQAADNKKYLLQGSINSKIEENERLGFVLSPKTPGIDTLYLKDGEKVVFAKVFRYEKYPDDVARLGGLERNIATREEVIAQRGLVVHTGNYKNSRVVLNFLLRAKGKALPEGETVLSINGNMLTPEAIAIIKKLKAGDTITFDSIRASCTSGRVLTLYPFSVTIR